MNGDYQSTQPTAWCAFKVAASVGFDLTLGSLRLNPNWKTVTLAVNSYKSAAGVILTQCHNTFGALTRETDHNTHRTLCLARVFPQIVLKQQLGEVGK